jgi:hypothetical protein
VISRRARSRDTSTRLGRGEPWCDRPCRRAAPARERPAGLAARLGLLIYAAYVGRQARWCARSAALVRAVRAGVTYSRLPSRWRAVQAGPVARCALIAQNIRFLLLAVTACVGWPAGFLWLTLGPLNLALVWVLWSLERGAARVARLPPPAANLVVAGGT